MHFFKCEIVFRLHIYFPKVNNTPNILLVFNMLKPITNPHNRKITKTKNDQATGTATTRSNQAFHTCGLHYRALAIPI